MAEPDPAGLGARLLARLLDALVVGLLLSAALALAGLPPQTIPLGGIEAWWRGAATALLWFGYYVGFEAGAGATLGKRLLRLRVVAADGTRATIGGTAVRNAWILLGVVPFVGGVAMLVAVVAIAVTIATHTQHRGQHDRLARTAVVTLPRSVPVREP